MSSFIIDSCYYSSNTYPTTKKFWDNSSHGLTAGVKSTELYTEGKPISIHVYQDGDVFIMSDDYMSFTLYKGLGVKTIPCLVMGEPVGDYVIDKMKIRFQAPAVVVNQE